MRGAQTEVFPYVLEQEKDLMPSEQTTFWLKVITAGESSASLRRYTKAFISKGNTQDLNEQAYKIAYRGEFLDAVKKVDNYQFGYKYPELMEKGYSDFDDQELIAKMFDELPDLVVKELVEAAKGKASLEETESKKSDSVSSSQSGRHKS